MHATRALADYIDGLRADVLTPATRSAVLRCVLDLLTAAVAGYRTPAATGARRAAREIYGGGDTAVWFAGETLNAAGAVFCNSVAASALDLDDGNRAARGHPGAVVIPAALAAAAGRRVSVDEFMLAVVAGYEVGVRVASARNAAPATVSRQSGRWAGYAAVATAARLRRPPPAQLAHALAIAGVTAPNQEANGSSGYSRLTGNDVKEGIAWSAATGISALHLAEAGLTGPEDILDHETHFSRAHLLDGLDGRSGLDGLGSNPRIHDTYFKPYSCCRYNHAAIDAFAGLMRQHRLSAPDILAVEVHTFGWALQLGNKTEPRNLVEVQYSIPYCIAVAAIMGGDALLPVGDDCLNRADVSTFARKVLLHKDAALDACFPAETPARVVIVTREGKQESLVAMPRGEPSNPMSWDDLCKKFWMATRDVLREEQQRAILQALERLTQRELDPLLDVLGARSVI